VRVGRKIKDSSRLVAVLVSSKAAELPDVHQDLASVSNKLAAANLFRKTIEDFQCNYTGDPVAQRAPAFLATVTSDPGTMPTQDELRVFFTTPISYTYTALPLGGWSYVQVAGINDNGQVAGYGQDASG
jgi:hypothetical protein